MGRFGRIMAKTTVLAGPLSDLIIPIELNPKIVVTWWSLTWVIYGDLHMTILLLLNWTLLWSGLEIVCFIAISFEDINLWLYKGIWRGLFLRLFFTIVIHLIRPLITKRWTFLASDDTIDILVFIFRTCHAFLFTTIFTTSLNDDFRFVAAAGLSTC